MTDAIEQYRNVGMAAIYLNEQLQDKTPEQYTQFLQSNRVKGRAVAYQIPFEKIDGMVIYLTKELNKYVALQKSRTMGTIKLSTKAAEALQAVGFNEHGGGSTGYRFNMSGLNFGIDRNGQRFIQMFLTEPLRVFHIEMESAEALHRELGELIAANSRMTQEVKQPHQQPDLSDFETVTDNQDVKIMRRKTK